MNLHVKTPLLESRRLGSKYPLWLKLENTQPSGSFKTRGIGYACQEYFKRGARRFVSSSGGNAGLAVAYSGRRLNVPVTVIVPESTSAMAKNFIMKEGAEIIVHGTSWAESHEKAIQLVDDNTSYLHPFDDPFIWKGHSTIVEEIAEQRKKPQAIILSVGGGGLFCGVVEGLKTVGWTDVSVICVETYGADSMHQSLMQGRRVTLDAITSIATSLGAKQIAEMAFTDANNFSTKSVVVTDKQAIQGCRKLLDAHHILVEPACGASVAAALSPNLIGDMDDIVVIVCGGVGVTDELLRNWEKI
jgi:L-serine/L-threonine ammonia-lyase